VIRTLRRRRALWAASLLLPLAVLAYASFANYRALMTGEDERIDRTLSMLEEHANKIFASAELVIRAAGEIANGASDAALRTQEASLHGRLKTVVRELTHI